MVGGEGRQAPSCASLSHHSMTSTKGPGWASNEEFFLPAGNEPPPPQRLDDLRTPCMIGFLDKIQRNCDRMLGRSKQMNCRLRPHVKTHKTVDAALIQTGGRRSGITCSTIAEAFFFQSAGRFDDILYAVPITADKFLDAMLLNNIMSNFHIMVDNDEMVSKLLEFEHQSHSKPWSVWVMVDCGYHRDGLDPESTKSIELVRRLLSAPGKVKLSGIYTHGGHSYGVESNEEIIRIATAERDAVVDFVTRLKSQVEGLGEVCVGVGSTPTCSTLPEHLNGVDEMHPGNYVYYDEMQVQLGSCQPEDVAVRVLMRVIGKYPEQNMLLVDCGWTGMSAQGSDANYGRIVGHNLCIKVLKQEAGEVTSIDGTPIPFDKYPIGCLLQLSPYHSCATTHQHRFIHILENEDSTHVRHTWSICKGW